MITKSYNMSDEEPEQALFTDEEFKEIMKESKPKQEGKLKDWRAYCKLRGKKSVQQEYSKDIQEVGSFNNVKDFFRLYTAIREPSQLEIDTKIMYFIDGCKPIWEEWLHSGCLLINVKFKDEKKDKTGATIVNRLWEYLLLSLIGNSLPSERLKKGPVVKEKNGDEDIVGIILQRRDKITLIELWFRHDHNAAALCRLIEAGIWKQLSFLNQHERNGIQIRYSRHRDSYTANSTMKGSYLLKTSLNDSF